MSRWIWLQVVCCKFWFEDLKVMAGIFNSILSYTILQLYMVHWLECALASGYVHSSQKMGSRIAKARWDHRNWKVVLTIFFLSKLCFKYGKPRYQFIHAVALCVCKKELNKLTLLLRISSLVPILIWNFQVACHLFWFKIVLFVPSICGRPWYVFFAYPLLSQILIAFLWLVQFETAWFSSFLAHMSVDPMLYIKVASVFWDDFSVFEK